jgi:N-acetylglucosaminyldiphosphoundecaprenol N-acetyl-beta-D-mannosaminyltransferase
VCVRYIANFEAQRVYGPDTALPVLEAAARRGVAVGFYGGAPATLERLVEAVRTRFSGIQMAYAWSPPFRPLTSQEDDQVVGAINGSGAHSFRRPRHAEAGVLDGGSPRARPGGHVLGVGAAFDFIAGAKPQAPRWMMRLGLEWLFRLCTEPRRLWRRYLINNPRFVVLVAGQLLRHHLSRRQGRLPERA